MRRIYLRSRLPVLIALGLASLACAVMEVPPEETTPTPGVIGTPSPVIVEPVSTPSPTVAPTAKINVQPTTVLGPTVTPTPPCINDAKFISDVTIPDNTSVAPGTSLDKLWQIQNTGTCAWDSTYHLVQISVSPLQAVTKEIPLPPVQPGDSAEIGLKAILSLEAPPGSIQKAVFELRDPSGKPFGTRLTIQVTASGPAAGTGTATGAVSGTISGAVWNDYCHPGAAEGGSGPTLGHCVTSPTGSAVADGIFESDEKGITGIKVELHSGACTDPVVATTMTDIHGAYSFAGLSEGQYCIAVNALDSANTSILIPGAWTQPPTTEGTATMGVTLSPQNMTARRINFGWDYQLD